MSLHRLAPLAVVALVLAGCSDAGHAGPVVDETPPGKLALRGAGATFPNPLYQRWIERYREVSPDVAVSYDSVGSGDGVKRFLAESVDFGASDAAMRDEEIADVERGVHMIPTTAGMVVVAFNVPEFDGELMLSRDVYVDIFLGKITEWNDPRIIRDNIGLEIPDRDIAVVVRQDGSGTTFAFTNHLSAISEEWRDRGPGAGKVIDWPGAAMVARGNEGVATKILRTPYSIGYVEFGMARRVGLRMAQLENRDGHFTAPSAQSGASALDEAAENMPANLRLFLPDPSGQEAYPIVTYTWLLLYGSYDDGQTSSELRRFVTWALTDGQSENDELGFVPLPTSVVTLGLREVNRVR